MSTRSSAARLLRRPALALIGVVVRAGIGALLIPGLLLLAGLGTARRFLEFGLAAAVLLAVAVAVRLGN